MAFTRSAIDAILKDDYQGPVREQINKSTVLLTKLKRRTKDFHGRRAYIPLHKGRNVGTNSSVEGSGNTLPTAGNQQYDKSIYDVRLLYGAIEISGVALKASKKDAGAFVRGLDSEMSGLKDDIRSFVNRQMFHDGGSALTNITAAGPTTNFTVDSTKFLQVGMPVDARVRSTGGSGVSANISSINSTTTITLDASVTVAANSALYRTNSRASGTWGAHQEMWGLEALCANVNAAGGSLSMPTATGLTDQVGSIDRSSNVFWQTPVFANGGTVRSLTLDLMQQADDSTEIEGDSEPGLILTNHAIKRRYASLLQADKRYPAGGEITLDGGYRALEFNGTPLVGDKDASLTYTPSKLQRIYFLTLDSLELQVLQDWGWLDEDGSVLKMKPGTGAYADSWQAYMGAYMELAVARPNANAVLDDIDENP